MYTQTQTNWRLPLQILIFATFVVFAIFMWQGNKGFSLWDEGYLWYGAQRVMLGEVPVRDFISYDPGRYYWSAALMRLWGNNGIMPLRAAVAVFQAIGLFVGLLLIARSTKKQDFIYLLLSTIILVVWMFPHYKLFDISLSILLIGVLAFLVQNPTSRRYFLAGLGVGLVAVFGRNHGMYGVAGSMGVMLWLCIKREGGPGFAKGFALWATGVTVGYMPILLMALFVPGFAIAFWESIRYLFEIGATNLPLPVPWPWHGTSLRKILIGLFFIAIVVLGVLSIIWVVWKKLQNEHVPPTLVAASFLALPYAHYAYSRADITHLAMSIFPLLIGSLVLLATQPPKVKWPLVLMLCGVSLMIMHGVHSGWKCRPGKQCVSIEISGSNLLVSQDVANTVGLLRQMADQYAPNGQNIIVTPLMVSAYAVLERKSPMRDIYAIRKRSDDFQRAEIESIKAANPGFVLLLDLALDGRDELRYINTHPIIYQYILDHFDPIPGGTTNPAYHLYKSRQDSP